MPGLEDMSENPAGIVLLPLQSTEWIARPPFLGPGDEPFGDPNPELQDMSESPAQVVLLQIFQPLAVPWVFLGASDDYRSAPPVEDFMMILMGGSPWAPDAPRLTLYKLLGASEEIPPVPPIDEYMLVQTIEGWEVQVARTIGFEEPFVPPPAAKLPGVGLRVLLRGLGLAPVYGSLAELAPSGITYVLLQFDASYPAGGYPLAPSALGFTTKALTFLPTAALVSSQGYFPVYDGANQAVRLFRAVAGQWVEPAAGTDLSRVVMDVAVAGY